MSALPSVPSVPPEQDAPVPPEEIDVTIVDSRTPTRVRPHSGNGARVAVATAPTVAPSAPAHTGLRRDPESRLAALFDAGTLEFLLPPDESGMLAGTGTIGGVATVAFASDPRFQGGAMGIDGCRVVVAAYEHAIDLAYKDYRVNPRDADTLSSLSLYYAKKGNTARALEFIHRARTLQPDAVQLLDVEAIVNALANRPKEALEAVRAALAKGYSAQEFKNEPELRSLQSLPEFQRLLAEADSKKK